MSKEKPAGDLTNRRDRAEENVRSELRKRGESLSDNERRQNELKVANMYLRGSSLAEICAEMDVDRKMVSYYLAKIEADWRLEMVKSIDDAKARELAKIDLVEAQAWEAWESSKQRSNKQQLTTDLASAITEGEAPVRIPRNTKVIQEDRDGNSRYLDIVFKCIDRRIKLLRIEDTPISHGAIVRNVEDARSRLEQYSNVLATPAIVLTAVDPGGYSSGQPVDSGRSPSEASRVSDIIDV